MYLDHFGLHAPPFRLTPDTAFAVDTPSQREALTTLEVALEQGDGFLTVVGEVGLGKTLLCRMLLNRLAEPFTTAWLPDPHLAPGTLRTAVARDFGIDLPSRPTQQRVHERLQQRLAELVAAGNRPVLLIDEAQALPDNTLETVRLLTNLETERRKLLQVVLFGQPELEQRLATHRFRPLRQRITHSCRLAPLDASGTAAYLRQRLRAAGGRAGMIAPAAVRALHRASGGVPRLVNVLADKSLLAAYGRGRGTVRREDVRRAVADTAAARQPVGRPHSPMLRRAAAFGAVVLGVFALLELARGMTG